jgi:hypothetical protein
MSSRVKHTNPEFLNQAFTYHVIDYDSKTREYVLQNPINKEVKRIPKEEYELMLKEQRHN